MNEFFLVRTRALEHRPESYEASDAFFERIKFEGPSGLKDKVACVLSMLELVALSPRFAELSLESLNKGWVNPIFFKTACPVAGFPVKPGSQEHAQLLAAYEANLAGPLFAAAVRARRVEQRPASLRRNHVGGFLALYLQRNPAPTNIGEASRENGIRLTEEWKAWEARRDAAVNRNELPHPNAVGVEGAVSCFAEHCALSRKAPHG